MSSCRTCKAERPEEILLSERSSFKTESMVGKLAKEERPVLLRARCWRLGKDSKVSLSSGEISEPLQLSNKSSYTSYFEIPFRASLIMFSIIIRYGLFCCIANTNQN